MKVIVISHMYPSSFNEIGGIFVQQQVKELINQGVEVKVVSTVPWSPFPINRLSKIMGRYADIPKFEIREGVEIYYPRYFKLPRGLGFGHSGFLMYWGLRETLKTIYRQFPFELIHAHAALPDGYAAMLANRSYQVPLTVTVHGQDLNYTIHKNKRWRKQVFKALEKADKIITVSHKLKSFIINNVTEKTIVINNGIDIDKVLLNNKYKISSCDGEKIVISVSNLNFEKGIDLNLRAIERIVSEKYNVKYWIIGDGPEREELLKLAMNLNITENVQFFGQLPNREAMALLAQADLFSLPSWREGFGIVYLEAMAQGKPVIAVEGEGINDAVEHGKTGWLVKSRDVDGLTAAMRFFLDNPREARDIGRRAQQLVREEFTWRRNCEKTISIYKQLLEKKIHLSTAVRNAN